MSELGRSKDRNWKPWVAGGAFVLALSALAFSLYPDGEDSPASHQPPSATSTIENPIPALLGAYASCQPSGDLEAYRVIQSKEPISTVRYKIEVIPNPEVASRADDLGITYRGLVAELVEQPGIPLDSNNSGTRGSITQAEGQPGVYNHDLPAMDVYGPSYAVYNLYAVAEATNPQTGEPIASYTPCDGILIEGNSNLGITRVEPTEFNDPLGKQSGVQLRPAA